MDDRLKNPKVTFVQKPQIFISFSFTAIFRLGCDNNYRNYNNQFTTNSLALNKVQSNEERDKKRQLSHKFSMATGTDFKWSGTLHGNCLLSMFFFYFGSKRFKIFEKAGRKASKMRKHRYINLSSFRVVSHSGPHTYMLLYFRSKEDSCSLGHPTCTMRALPYVGLPISGGCVLPHHHGSCVSTSPSTARARRTPFGCKFKGGEVSSPSYITTKL